MKQLSLFKISRSFGGTLLLNKRKTYRPITSQKPLHLIFKSEEVLNYGGFKKHYSLVGELLSKYSKNYNIKIYNFTVCSNHIHFVVRYKDKKQFQNFLRVFAGVTARKISNKKGFWPHRPFTRVVEWGRDFDGSLNYLDLNELETRGLIDYRPR